MDKINNRFLSIGQVTGSYFGSVQNYSSEVKEEKSFDEILKEKTEQAAGLKFSKHASLRLEERNISLTEEQNLRLKNGVEKADEKGIRESLVMVDSLAFIVNVPNKTVVTAMDQMETQNTIFTNIDGAVIM